jgi:hypothetical protein
MSSPSAAAFRASRAVGAMFFSLFGGAWIVLWSYLAYGFNPGLMALITLAALGQFAWALTTYHKNKGAFAEDSDPAKKKAEKVFHIVNAAQWVLILIVANVLKNTGHGNWVLAAIIIIVGLHFLPLAPVFRYPVHYVTGVALVTWGAGYPFLLTQGAGSPLGCLGAGLLLWASAITGLTVKPF